MASPSRAASHAGDLCRRESELRAELKAIRRGEKAARRSARRSQACTPWMRQVAVRVYALKELDVDAATKDLLKKGRAVPDGEVREWYETMTPDARALLVQTPEEDKCGARQLAEARRFVEELRLVLWVSEQNASKGVAPTASAVLGQAGPALSRGRLMTSRYRWLRRCMARWGGRFAHGDLLTCDEFRDKACTNPSFGSAVCLGPAVSVSGPEFGPCFRTSLYDWVIGGPEMRTGIWALFPGRRGGDLAGGRGGYGCQAKLGLVPAGIRLLEVEWLFARRSTRRSGRLEFEHGRDQCQDLPADEEGLGGRPEARKEIAASQRPWAHAAGEAVRRDPCILSG